MSQIICEPVYMLGRSLSKEAGAPVTVHALSGELYLSKSGWLLLDVPNSLVRGAFDALHELGAELPFHTDGSLNAHVTVMRPEEIEQIGGADKITERGHQFKYTLGPLKECVPDGWTEMAKVWFIEVKSKQLEQLRKSYGLSALPKEGKHAFHITIATRRKKVLQNNDVKKASVVSNAANLINAATIGEAISAHHARPDPLDAIINDTSHLDALKQLPTDISKPRKRRRPMPPQLAAAISSVPKI